MIEKLLNALNINIKELPKRYTYFIIIILFGALLMILSNIITSKQEANQAQPEEISLPTNEINSPVSKVKGDFSQQDTIDQLETKMEEQLKEILEQSTALSDVNVMVNLDSTNIQIYEKNLIKGKQVTDELDQNGGKRKVEDDTEERQIVLIRTGDQEKPLLIQTEKPIVRGVLVVAKGLENKSTQMMVIDAIAKVLDVPSHRISLMNKE